MYYILSESVNNSSKAFVLNGLEYQKDVYTVLYSSYEDNNGTPENVYISIVNKSTGAPLISNTKITRFSDGDQFFTSAGQILSYLGGGADARFIITVKTDNAGTSASNQFTLPWIGTYDVEWGDGSSDVGVSGTQTHTYASAGTYDVAVTATSGRVFFEGTTDKGKVIDIKNWGAVQWTSMERAFRGCALTVVSATDIPDFSALTNTNVMFTDCSLMTSISVDGWDMSSVTNIGNMFQFCVALPTLDVSDWNTSNVTNIGNFLFNCASFKADFSGLDINSITNALNFAAGTNINETGTTTNYDNTLISWAAQSPQNNIVINFGTAKYSTAAAAARELLTRAVVDGGYGWTITDGGVI